MSIPKFFVLGDSHARCFPARYVTSSFEMWVKSVSGLKWIDRWQSSLCSKECLSTREVSELMSEWFGVVLLIGTNSLRIFGAQQVIDEVKEVVGLIREKYGSLNDRISVAVMAAFPCLKLTRKFPSESLMLRNIDGFNEGLKALAIDEKFTVIDCNMKGDNLASDLIHIYPKFHRLIFDSVVDHFGRLAEERMSLTTASSNVASVHNHSAGAIGTKPNKSSNRSENALRRLREKNFAKLKAKRNSHSFKRKVCPKWTYSELKIYLRSMRGEFPD